MAGRVSMEENKSLVRRYVEEVWNEGGVAALEGFLAPGYRRHLSPGAAPLDREGQRARVAGFRAGFPDIHFTVEEVFAEGDRVTFRATVRGTHRGMFLGLAPTGRRVAVSVIDVVSIEDGRFAERWGGPDMLDLLQQLGAGVSTGRQ